MNDIVSPRTRMTSNLHALNIPVENEIFVCQDLSHLEIAYFLIRHDPQLYICLTKGPELSIWPTYGDLLTTYEILYDCEKVTILQNKRTKDIFVIYGLGYLALLRFARHSPSRYVAMEKGSKPLRPAIKQNRDIAKELNKLGPNITEAQRKKIICDILVEYLFDYENLL